MKDEAPDVDASDQTLYSMGVVTRLTGVSADTIRAWERRYQAITPHRTAGNTRRFRASDVRRLTLLKEATEAGHAISTIAQLELSQLEKLVADVPAAEAARGETSRLDDERGSFERFRESYLAAVLRFDTQRAANLLLRAAMLLEPRDFVFKVLLPIVQEIGERWAHTQLGVAQEHLASAQLSGLLTTLLRVDAPNRRGVRVLFTTPQGHRHQLGILVGALLAASRGIEAVFLGPDLPDDELIWSVGMSRADVLVLSVVKDVKRAELDRLVPTLETLARRVPVWIGAPEGHALRAAAPQATFFDRFEDFDVALVGLTTRTGS